MLVLSALQNLLSQVLDPPTLHSAVLCTAAERRAARRVGIAGEVWLETRGEGAESEGSEGMVDSELGRIIVIPIVEGGGAPLMLLALNGTESVAWEDLQSKGRVLAQHLARHLSKFREHLIAPRSPPAPTPAQR
ncbi:hypothetical protein BD626DRAFT_570741 [Schizophyllum amplum]|uniref:Uncharacterized protein n=1 Tax=Schizophyllum amplum TaxID=97359 RepID=A0A550C9R0_9AGAR|nr:hypothetical protein BD626DRAFT_570741 [Auriculariopsis ampla]